MTPKNTIDPDDNPLGVLDEAASLDTAGIGILGGTAQVSVTLPMDDDDDLADDGVVEGEVVGDLVIDPRASSNRRRSPRRRRRSSHRPRRSGRSRSRERPTQSRSRRRHRPQRERTPTRPSSTMSHSMMSLSTNP
ncbi:MULTISPECIES: hypothetical protein [unclassified Microbacterium]|uniref:hypothetical protein n=1 Tax=unclassified Microbacterium TaxID=2609290 RepID=UPI0016054741|nr:MULTISPECIES: hypothetical protein [unclassified Microbacterium]QYM63089.1 hypothetical protein K1X59_12295 [Microbacterium sp. Se5.02b]